MEESIREYPYKVDDKIAYSHRYSSNIGNRASVNEHRYSLLIEEEQKERREMRRIMQRIANDDKSIASKSERLSQRSKRRHIIDDDDEEYYSISQSQSSHELVERDS